MEIEWFVANVTAMGSPDRAERAILGVILAGRVFGHARLFLWWGSRFLRQEPPRELNTLLRVI